MISVPQITIRTLIDMVKSKLLISHVDDIHNIYHLFVGEIDAIWKTTEGDPNYSILLKHYTDDASGRWRLALLNSMYDNVYIGELPKDLSFEEIHEIKDWVYGMVDNQTFSQIAPSPFHIEMAGLIKAHYGTGQCVGEKVVYVERAQSRILFDYETKVPLGDYLSNKCAEVSIAFNSFNFDQASFEFQLETLSRAKILLACHGAANTNLFLLPSNAALFEVNFRKYWFCDPVCRRHLSGEISYQTDCGGPLTWKDTFHKAEYHNLAQLFGVAYLEFEITDAEHFLNDNPIELESIFVDGAAIFRSICATML